MFTFLKTLKMPHVFMLILWVIAGCAIATYLIPSGTYERETVTIEGRKRSVVVPGTYAGKQKSFTLKGLLLAEEPPENQAAPTSLHGFLMAIPKGLEKSADIIFFIFLIGGTFGILQRSGLITAGVHALLEIFKGLDRLLIVAIMFVLAVGGSMLGMGEEFIPLVPIFLLLSSRMGYDRVVGMAIVILAAQVGFAAATTNPFTLGVAQGIAEVKPYSGILFRMVFFAVCFAITVAYILYYASKVKADPAASVVADVPADTVEADDVEQLTRAHMLALILSIGIFAGVIFGSVNMGWWMSEMSGGFLLMGILVAVVCKMKLEVATNAFVKGMGEMVVAALVVGFARGIEVVLTESQVLDTLIYSAANILKEVPQYVAVQGMFIFQSGLNFLIPSGSGQAAVTMPLMAPLADVLGITRQTAVFAFQCGDGLSNTIIPTSGILMAMLALAKIPFGRWLRFMMPLFLMLTLNAMIFLGIAVAIGYS